MECKKILSIVIPTYNRCTLLPFTLSFLYEQLERNSNEVELIICNNLSTDDTEKVLGDIQQDRPYITVINYKDHVEIGDSIKRSASNANGDYLLLWSDDDIPSPFLIDSILWEIKKYPNVGCLGFNRIEGYSKEVSPISGLFLTRKEFYSKERVFSRASDYLEEFFCDMSFMSQNVIQMNSWKEGLNRNTEGYLGFEFMGPLLFGLRDKQCIYLDYPLCIERHPSSSGLSYANRWLLYIFIGIPRILKDLETEKIITNWRTCYKKFHYAANTFVFIKGLFSTCVPNQNIYFPYKEEMKLYQEEKIRIFFIEGALTSNVFKRGLYRCLFNLIKPYLIVKSYPLKKIINKMRSL